MTRFQHVGVLGAGLMGGGIAQVSATAGHDVTLCDVSPDALERRLTDIRLSLARLVHRQRLDSTQAAAALDRIAPATDVSALAGADLVIEAVPEDLALKTDLFAQLGQACGEATVLASNTSSLPIAAMAVASGRPDRCLGLHFFSPVPLMPLVEVVRALGTSTDTFERAMTFARGLGKEAVAARDTPGFIVNRLLVPYIMDAIRARERGVASTRDLDLGMKLGCGHPMGPLTLADMIGLDTILRVGDIMFDEFREPQYAPPPLLRRLVTMGHLGRKSGRGFYDYAGEQPVVVDL